MLSLRGPSIRTDTSAAPKRGISSPGNVDPPGTVVPVAATGMYGNVARVSGSEA
jgi:hypothetical protein